MLADVQMVGQDIFVEQDWRDAFADQLRERGKSENTISAYLQDLRSFAAWYAQVNGSEFQISDMTGFDLRAYHKYIMDDCKMKPATWNRRRSSLIALCRWSVESGCLSFDPSIDLIAEDDIELAPRWLERKDANRLMRQAERMANGAQSDHWRWQATRDQAVLALMLYAGLREGEVVALDLADIEIGVRKGRVTVHGGKTGYRRVPLSKEARRALTLWLDARAPGAGALFQSKRAKRMSRRAVIHRVVEIGRLADLKVTPHDLRHTCAKRMLDEGTPLTVVRKVLGHARLETTARYVQPSWGDLELAVERI